MKSCGECKFHNQPDENGLGECTFLSGDNEGRVMSEGVVKTPVEFFCAGFEEAEGRESLLRRVESEIEQSRPIM
jgi:hypothetical protein